MNRVTKRHSRRVIIVVGVRYNASVERAIVILLIILSLLRKKD